MSASDGGLGGGLRGRPVGDGDRDPDPPGDIVPLRPGDDIDPMPILVMPPPPKRKRVARVSKREGGRRRRAADS
jgi:hypothetical protein